MLSLRPSTKVVVSEIPEALETVRPAVELSLGLRGLFAVMTGLLAEVNEPWGDEAESGDDSVLDSFLLPGTILPLVNCVSRSTENDPIVMARSSCLSGICRP